ncbi:hypothetical protein GcM3_217021 [Golovinomyces cichoracearum]|uniref:MULE transposase domain-containing protein n=1 Tax=Golovinomyces cichoracearum TaxID=62708 RepID=A0A420H812_9PEZI|nr:hypothetical protein GcM3_217021 [Golovinomyces cichoracearum]
MSEPIYLNSSSFHVEIFDQYLVDISNIYITSIEAVIQNGDSFEKPSLDPFETEFYQSFPHDNESNVNLLNSDDKTFHHDGEVTITNPPVQMYKSLEEVITALYDFSRDQGFEITRGGAKRRIGKSTGCHPSNCPGSCSKLTDCPWAIMIYTDNIQDPNGSEAQWSFRFGKSTEHNHGGVHASSLANHRRKARGEEVSQFIKRTVMAGVEPKRAQIPTYQKFSNRAENLILTRDLHNDAARSRHEICNLRTPVEVAMSILDDNFFWGYEINNESSDITMLFFAQYSMFRILRDNPQVIIIDATYGTQKYGLPLFTIIVITRVEITILVAYCFMEREAGNNITWALEVLRDLYFKYETELPRVIFNDRDRACINALHAIFPTTSTMLCRWHMDTDVRVWLRVAFGEE